MKKKIIVLAFSAMLFALCVPADAQQPTKIPRIGVLRPERLGDAEGERLVEAFRRGLRDLGYLEGKNVVIEYRYAEGKLDRFPDLAAELVRLKVDIMVAVNESGVQAAKNATKTIPIVMVEVGPDPVDAGLVESLARPGGNITGLTMYAVEMGGKRLELFKEAVPKVARVAVLYDPANPGNLVHVKEVQTAARPLGLIVQSWEVRDTNDFEKVFTALSSRRLNGVYLPGGPLLTANAKRTAGFALKSRLPSVYVRKDAVDAGGLMSYGPDTVEQNRRAATYVDKILKGAKPADLPVERPTKFEFVINLKTAKQIGLTIPQKVLGRADKVIK
jgi:ABC-type uncharacterized transport system substrate-binding protein